MLLRRYIGRKLADYYAQPQNRVVGKNPEEIALKSLLGEWHWRRVYQRLYDTQEGQWLTPVELFQPYYSAIFANFCAVEASQHNTDFEIVELGGGRGTNASCILDQLMMHHPNVYERLAKYTVIDSSHSLHDLQKQMLSSVPHTHLVDCQIKDLADVAESRLPLMATSNTHTIFISLELLDNLGHDKVRRCPTTRKLEQAIVHQDASVMVEAFQPLTDKLLSNVLLKVPSYGGIKGIPMWVPTVACGVLDHVKKLRPNSSIVFADFDWLPGPDEPSTHSAGLNSSSWAQGEPLVTDMDGIDYKCYLQSPHLCDVLFPTDFSRLSSFCEKVFNNKRTKVWKQHSFLSEYGKKEVQETKSWLTGYSPMLNDFVNCSVLEVSKLR